MGALTIRNLDDAIVAAIKRRAGEHGLSMEEEVRRLLAASYGASRPPAKIWARQERLEHGELPKADRASMEEIRQMRSHGRDELRQRLNDSIARGGVVTDAQLDAAIAKKRGLLAKEGY